MDRNQAQAAADRLRERARKLKSGAFDWKGIESRSGRGLPVSFVPDSSVTLA